MCTSSKPFLPTGLFTDRSFAAAIIMVFCVSAIMQATGALLAPYLQKLAGFAPQDAGWAMAPRGVDIMISMFVAACLAMRVDQRKLMAIGLTTLGFVLYDMSTWTPAVSSQHMAMVMMIQGVSVGLVFNPLTVMAYTTLPPHFRGEATAVQSLARNIGAGIGISVMTFSLTRAFQTNHEEISSGITPFNRVLQGGDQLGEILDPTTRGRAAVLDQMITYQAQIISYNNDFRLMTLVVLPPLLLLLLMRRHARPNKQ